MTEESRKFYICRNNLCHRKSRTHSLGTKCDFDVTAHCEVCRKPLYERDREYAWIKFGKITCAAHCGDRFWETK